MTDYMNEKHIEFIKRSLENLFVAGGYMYSDDPDIEEYTEIKNRLAEFFEKRKKHVE